MSGYENYTLSPVPWIKQMPEHWGLVRGKNLYQKMQRPTSDTDEVVTCFRDGTVTLRKNRRTTGFTESLKEIGYQGIRKGDLVIHVMDAFAGSIGVSDSDGKGTPVYSVCQAKGNSNNQYYALLLREMARSGYIQSLYRGIRERSSDFRFEVFAAQFYPVPPREEQDQIVRFLDWKVSSINKLIKDDRDSRDLLFSFKRCMVHFAVDDARIKFCTKLAGKDSWFLPFDKGYNDGAGNPPNPDGIMTDYLWKDILTKEKLGHIVEPEMDLLSVILSNFNDMFGNINWNDADNVRRQILEIPAMVSKDEKYQNAMRNSDEQSARLESERALQQVIFSIMSDNMELFKQFQDNPSFKKWLSDMVFNLTYNKDG